MRRWQWQRQVQPVEPCANFCAFFVFISIFASGWGNRVPNPLKKVLVHGLGLQLCCGGDRACSSCYEEPLHRWTVSMTGFCDRVSSGICDRVSYGIFHSVRDPVSCDFVLFTCDGGHLDPISLRVCSGPQQTRYFASIPALAETSTDRHAMPRFLSREAGL